jgi:hypothetical protein
MASPRFRLALAMMAGSKTGETTAEISVVMTAAMIGAMTAEVIATTVVMVAETTVDAVDYRDGTDPPHARKLSGLTKYGNVTLKRVPLPVALVTSIRPSWASMIFRTIASPRPDPCAFVVKNALNTRSFNSAGIPGPSSAISTMSVGTCARPSLRCACSCSTDPVQAEMRTRPEPESASNALMTRLVNT